MKFDRKLPIHLHHASLAGQRTLQEVLVKSEELLRLPEQLHDALEVELWFFLDGRVVGGGDIRHKKQVL